MILRLPPIRQQKYAQPMDLFCCRTGRRLTLEPILDCRFAGFPLAPSHPALRHQCYRNRESVCTFPLFELKSEQVCLTDRIAPSPSTVLGEKGLLAASMQRIRLACKLVQLLALAVLL